MYKHHAKYIDFNGNSREEDFYFNLTEAEVAVMELEINGGMTAMIDRIVAAQDSSSLIHLFQDFIKRSYGVKTLDGKGFDKSEKVVTEFLQTQAYSDLFMKLAKDATFAAEFFNAVIPKKAEAASATGPVLIPAAE